MDKPRPGTARALIYAAIAKEGPECSAAQIVRAIGGRAQRGAIDMALQKGAQAGDIIRMGESRAYRYSLAPAVLAVYSGADAKRPGKAANTEGGTFAPSLGARCSAAPANRSQGTIEDALRAVLSEDAPLPLDEVLRLLPIGWSRTEAISGLKEAALDGWANYGPDGWQLVGEPPAPRAEDPASVRAIPNHMHLRLQEVDGQVREQLRDAVTLGRSPLLCAALANASAELNKALALIDA